MSHGTARETLVQAKSVSYFSTGPKGKWDDLSHGSLEAIAVEAYRTGLLHESQVRRLMGFETRYEVHGLLKRHGVPLDITAADVEADVEAHRQLGILPRR